MSASAIIKPKRFDKIIGQESAKTKLGFYLDKYEHSHIFPNLLFVAQKGNGKTTLAREVAKGLFAYDEFGQMIVNPDTQKPKRKTFLEINCSTIKGVKQFFNSVMVPSVVDKDVTVLFDEASEIPHDVAMALLTVLNPNDENRTTFAIEDFVCDFDFRKQTFLFATSEAQGMFHALKDRLKRIDLEEYSLCNLARIVQRNLPHVNFLDGVLESVVTVLRGNARAAKMMADDIALYLGGKDDFGPGHWDDLCKTLGILPLGLNSTELDILRYLHQSIDGTSLTCLSAKTGLSRECLQKDYEMYLQKMGLMEIATTGRKLTPKGCDYLKQTGACKA